MIAKSRKKVVSITKLVGIVTEDRGALTALPELYEQLQKSCNVIFFRPALTDAHPLSPVPILVRRIIPRIRYLQGKGASTVIVLLDSESRRVCPGERAQLILEALRKEGLSNIQVVMKRTQLENWLIADRAALEAMPRLFPSVQFVQFPTGQADEVDAYRVICIAMGRNGSYSKSEHPRRIFARSSIDVLRSNSRSFDKFVRVAAEVGKVKLTRSGG